MGFNSNMRTDNMLRSNTMPTQMKGGMSGQMVGNLQEQQKMFNSGSNLYDGRNMGLVGVKNILVWVK